jgi:hypothetical protein
MFLRALAVALISMSHSLPLKLLLNSRNPPPN